MNTLLNACKGSSDDFVKKLRDPEQRLLSIEEALAGDPSIEDLRAILYYVPETSAAAELLLAKSNDVADLVLVACCNKALADDVARLAITADQLTVGQKLTLLVHSMSEQVKALAGQMLLAEVGQNVETCLWVIRWTSDEEQRLQAWETLLANSPTLDHLGYVVRFGNSLRAVAAEQLKASGPQPKHERILERCCAQA